MYLGSLLWYLGGVILQWFMCPSILLMYSQPIYIFQKASQPFLQASSTYWRMKVWGNLSLTAVKCSSDMSKSKEFYFPDIVLMEKCEKQTLKFSWTDSFLSNDFVEKHIGATGSCNIPAELPVREGEAQMAFLVLINKKFVWSINPGREGSPGCSFQGGVGAMNMQSSCLLNSVGTRLLRVITY